MKDAKIPFKKGKRPPKNKEVESERKNKLGLKGDYYASYGQEDGIDDMSEESNLQQLIEGSERFRAREMEQLVEQWGAPEQHLEKMPMAKQPEKIKAKLLPYQLQVITQFSFQMIALHTKIYQGLEWMLSMENPKLPPSGSKDVVQLWKRSEARAGLFTNIATNYSTATEPALAKGGILADDMGLGKTLEIISLIVQGSAGSTLIIAPVSVMSNWSQQIETHVKEKFALKVLTYHGSNRKTMGPKEFGDYDVVITTYGT
jgi:SWI/SNF-related matrix-associated actin-dependent regulator of chromatin subfamily A3